MSVIRVEKNKNYTTMANYHLRNKELSLKAKGLMSVILSLPDNWEYSIAGLVSISKEGESAVKSALRELESNGFVTVDKIYPDKTKSGRIEYEYTIHEMPMSIANQQQEPSSLGIEKQGVENQGVVFQGVENHGQLSTKEVSTEQLSTYNQEEKKLSKRKEVRDKPKNDDSEKKSDSLPYSEIIDYLNQKAGKKYRVTQSVRRLISARFGDGYTLDDFKRVIDTKCSGWEGTKYEKYLQPSTLFADGHFDNYLNERPKRSRNDEYDDFSAYDKSVPVRDSAKPDTSVPDDWDDIPF